MALTSREFQYLCIWCFLVTQDIFLHFCPFTIKPGQTIFSACAIITSSGTIEINTAVDITCINQPYTGTHIWKFNTAEVLICGFTNCVENASNPTRFSFVNDRGNGVFVFTINPVTHLDDETIIGCHNGSVEDTLKLEVKGKLDPPKNFQFNENINNDGMPYVSLEPGSNGGCDQTFFEQFEKKFSIKTHNQTLKARDKPDPPTDFMFNENISSYGLPYVSWVPGFDGGCPQTFFLQFETPNQTNTGRENHQDQENTDTTAAERNELKFVESHSETLDVESNKMFALPSHNETATICKHIKGLEPSSLYTITLYGENKYGKSEVMTLYEETNEVKMRSLRRKAFADGPSPVRENESNFYLKFIDTYIGYGVFANEYVKKGEQVLEYKGRLVFQHTLTEESLAEETGFRFYFKHNGKMLCIDATNSSGLGRMVNDEKDKNANCRMRKIVVGNEPKLFLYATKDIHPHEQLTYDYGEKNLPWRNIKVIETFALMTLTLYLHV